MNQTEWKFTLRNKKDIKLEPGFFNFRNKAVNYFSLQKGFVIHHLRDTEEQRNFNDNYYERWGFDFNDQMKYCAVLSIEDHRNYHKHSEETKLKIRQNSVGKRVYKPLSEETKKKISESKIRSYRETGLKPWNKGLKDDPRLGKAYGKRSDEARKHIRDATIVAMKDMSAEKKELMSLHRKGKPSHSKGKRWYNNGTSLIYDFECPEGFKPGIGSCRKRRSAAASNGSMHA